MIELYDGNNVMRRAYERKFQMPGQKTLSLRQRLGSMNANHIWVWDGGNHNLRRREIYPLYKMNRTPMAEDVFAQVRLWKDLLKHTSAVQIRVYGWEADDVIGTLVRKHPGRFRVHTNDMDYGQIAHLCQLEGVNLKGIEPKWIPLYKALCGDSSDNIKGIPGFGPKAWELVDKEAIQAAIVAGRPEAFAGLELRPAIKAWLLDPENIRELQAMLTITHFYPVPDDEIEGGTSVGTPNPQAANDLLKEFFL